MRFALNNLPNDLASSQNAGCVVEIMVGYIKTR